MPAWLSPRQTAAEIARARHIAQVLVRNGLGFVVEITGLTRYLPPWHARRVSRSDEAAGPQAARRLRRTLEELGPTYIKLGQILSTRPDILPGDYVLELSRLQDAAPAVPAPVIVATIEAELGQSLSSLYARFDVDPIASASIGQVHRATLPDGTPVVVKVQRPEIDREVQADLHLLQAQARFLQHRSSTLEKYTLAEIVDEFSASLYAEMDYRLEGRNADRLRDLLPPDDVLLPTVYWDRTSKRVLTMSDLQGIKISDREGLLAAGYDLHEVAERVIDAYLSQVFVHGTFHADPHPANIMVCGDRLGLVDLGNVGRLSGVLRDRIGELLFSLVRQDAEEMVSALANMGAMSSGTDASALRRELQYLIQRYYDVSLEHVHVGEFLGELMAVAFRHQVRLPADLTLLARTVLVLEGVVRHLDPSVVLAKRLEPFIIRLIRERVSPRRLALDAVKTLDDLRKTLQILPKRIDLITDQITRGDLSIGVDLHRLDQMLRRAEAVGNRLSFSVVVAAIIMGSALIMLGGEEAAAFRVPLSDIVVPVPQIGFLMAGVLGAWWLLSIIRSRGL